MELNFDILASKQQSVIAIGTFDGVHTGHQFILNTAKKTALEKGLPFFVLTFSDHPALITKAKEVPQLLTIFDEKMDLLHKFGVDNCIIMPFSSKFASLTYQEFTQKNLVDLLKVKHIFVGYNFHFGYKAQGNGESLKSLGEKMNFDTHIISPIQKEGFIISSSLIRSLIQNSKISLANKLLGYDYSLKGKVIEGQKIAAKGLGFPTANLKVNERKLLPANGVYSCKVKVDNKVYSGVMNIGFRPTFNQTILSLEVHILNFNKDIYDKTIEVQFIDYLREERKFENIDALKRQIETDVYKAVSTFALEREDKINTPLSSSRELSLSSVN